MIIRVSEAGAVAIEDHDLFTGFHVDAPVGHTAEDIAAVQIGRASCRERV